MGDLFIDFLIHVLKQGFVGIDDGGNPHLSTRREFPSQIAGSGKQ
jgi:hypothetical protein